MTIPSHQIVVVTGDPRSGTSLMMQTLKLLGVPVAGEEFPQARRAEGDNDRAAAQLDKVRELNPKGFFEVPGVVMRGLREVGEHGGKAIKIIAPGLTRTPESLIHKGILCLRDPRHVAQSQTQLQAGVAVAGARGWDSPTWNVSAVRYMMEMGAFLRWWADQTSEYRGRFIVVDYDEFLGDPTATVARIASHLSVTPTQAAIDNVDPTLRRSPDKFTAWPEAMQDDGEQCEAIYAAIKSGDPAEFEAAVIGMDQRIDYHRRERTMVYSDELCACVTAGSLRRLKANPALWARLTADREARVRIGHTFDTSPDYGGETQDVATIPLPADMGGDVQEAKVVYQGQAVTRAQAQALHFARRLQGQKAVDPVKRDAKLAALKGGA